jgi:2-polyprenyl-6-methoxyphenol hydroxylase-like FAD-dependent oxidoreductase
MQTSGERAEFDLSVLSEDTAHPYRLQCRQELLGRALAARLPLNTVHFSSPVTSVAQDKDGVSITLNDDVVRGSILIGCDGARSIVREAIGAIFEGETYPENTILVTTHFPFEDHLDGLSGVNYIWKPGGTYSLLRLPELWRISLHPSEGQTPKMALEDSAIRAQTREVLPLAGDIEIVEKRIYRVHRRVATHYRKNRIFIAGDAAHLNSPKGGMGMNGGIHDAWCLADLLIEVANGGDPQGLDKYEARRRPIARDDIVAQADKNRARMSAKNEAKRHEYLRSLKEIAANPIKARKFLLRSSMIEGLRRSEMLA